ncbi:ras-related protein Rab-33B isoform X2 [Salminus brasiliensis]|uniref:ras-related protein Rab-33B isoform X2 n=1 Tax=Salminus brasiliensis TaxID=930266 RepID=UPI003B82DDCC
MMDSLSCRTVKVIVLGDSGVGKTCLTHRFCTGNFPSKTEATIGVDFRERVVEVEGEKLKLWDTAGQERFRKSMVQHYYRDVHAILFVYDVTNTATFRSLPVWMEECRQHSLGHDVPRVLVGNKADLTASSASSMTLEQARRLADVHGMPFYLCSAKGDGKQQVDAIFMTLAHRLKRQGRLRRKGPSVAGSFKLPAKAKVEREKQEKWACSC